MQYAGIEDKGGALYTQACELKPISSIAESLKLSAQHIEPHGTTKAKVAVPATSCLSFKPLQPSFYKLLD